MSEENLNEVTDLAAVEPVEAVEHKVVESTESNEVVTGRDAAERAFDKAVADAENRVKPEAEKKEEPKEEAPVEATTEATEGAQEPAKGLDPQGKGPNSWKATVREKFKALPADVQAEVLRRENEHQRLMAETTDARKFANEFLSITQPYEAFLRSQNIHPLGAVKALMNDVYTLKTGDATTKANLIAQIIKSNGVDIGVLDQVLSGQMPQVDEHTAALQRQVQEMQQWKAQQEAQARQASEQTIEAQIHSFASDPANEFFHDVVSDMQVLLNAGHATDLKDAYDKACRLNPEVFSVLQARATARTAPAVTPPPAANVQQKVAASSSVKGAPASTRPAAPKKQVSGRDAALEAWARLEKTNRS